MQKANGKLCDCFDTVKKNKLKTQVKIQRFAGWLSSAIGK